MTLIPDQKQKINELRTQIDQAKKKSQTPAIGWIGLVVMVIGLWLYRQASIPQYVGIGVVILGALAIIPMEVMRARQKKLIAGGYRELAEYTQAIVTQQDNPALCDGIDASISTRTTISFRTVTGEDDVNDIIALDLGDKYFINTIYQDVQAWMYIGRFTDPERYIRFSYDSGTVTIQAWLVSQTGVEMDLTGQTLKGYKKVHKELMEHLQDKILSFDGTFDN